MFSRTIYFKELYEISQNFELVTKFMTAFVAKK